MTSEYSSKCQRESQSKGKSILDKHLHMMNQMYGANFSIGAPRFHVPSEKSKVAAKKSFTGVVNSFVVFDKKTDKSESLSGQSDSNIM